MAQHMTGENPDELGPGDAEMADLRAFAAEVVRTAGGVPRTLGYRPRLQLGARVSMVAPAELFSGLGWRLRTWVRERPLRTAGLALAAGGAVVALLVLRSTLAPADHSLELAGSLPHPAAVASAPAPPPPPVITLPDTPPKPAAPPPAVAQEAPVKREVAPVTRPPAPDPSTQRRRGRRVEVALASSSRAKEPKRAAPAPRAKKVAAAPDRRELIAGMMAIQPQLKRCYAQYGERGVVALRVELGSSGLVTRAAASGPLARTRTAACVKAALKSARFHVGGISFDYPVVLP